MRKLIVKSSISIVFLFLVLTMLGIRTPNSTLYSPETSNGEDIYLEWERDIYASSPDRDSCIAIVNDTEGNAFIVGNSEVIHDTEDIIFITKYNTSGHQQFLTTWNRYPRQYARDIALDLDGNIVVLAEWNSEPNNIILIKFDEFGDEIWNKTWHWNQNLTVGWEIRPYGFDLDSSGNIYVTGDIADTHPIMFLTKFNSLGIEQWNWTYSSTNSTYGKDVCVDSDQNIHLVGIIDYNINIDGFHGLFTSAGTQLWNKTHAKQRGEHVEIDNEDNVLIAEEIGAEVNLLKYDKNGVFQWNSSFGGSGYEQIGDGEGGIITDTDNNIFMVYSSSSFTSHEEILLVKFNSSGSYQWHKIKETAYGTNGYGVALGISGSIYVIGRKSTEGWTGSTGILMKYGYDTLAPVVTINSPLEGAIYGNNAPNYALTIDEPNLDTIRYSLDNGASNHTTTALSGTIKQVVWDGAPTGELNLTFYARDHVGLEGTTYVTIVRNPENRAPRVTSSPNDISVYSDYTGQILSWTATDDDDNSDTYTIELAGIGLVVDHTPWISGTAVTYPIPDGLDVGSHTYIITFYDDDGVSVTDWVVFTVETVENPTIPGFSVPLIFFIGVCTVVCSLVIFKKKVRII